jgi:single-strand DNA-binding protein
MSDTNVVVLKGRLVRDPETRQAGSSTVTAFTVANSREWGVGEARKKKTSFIRCEAWGKTGEFVMRFFQKGKEIEVEGRLETDEYEKDGKKQTKTKVTVSEVHFVGKKEGGTPAEEKPAGGNIPDFDEDGPNF